MKKTVALFLFVFFCLYSSVEIWAVQDFDQKKCANQLIKRMLPTHYRQFDVEILPSLSANDYFELSANNGKILLRGNNGVSIASALNYYLKNIAHCDYTYLCGNQLNLPTKLLFPKSKIHIETPNKLRYAYNYCTHGYTMAWWDWQQWEKEIDFMAFNGFNLALVIQGQEMIAVNTFSKYGYTQQEIQSWLCMPTHYPWMLMSNLQNYGGPVPMSIIRKRAELGKLIVNRMRSLGIEPMLMAFCGMIPPNFKIKNPESKIIETGKWCNHQRPNLLYPTTEIFKKVAQTFYQEQSKLLGKATYFSGDLFHEGSVPKGINVDSCGQNIANCMQEFNPHAIWALQAWGANPLDQLIRNISKNHLMILDLNCEINETWRTRKAFNGIPFIWCTVLNFGGNNGWDAILDNLSNKFVRALNDPKHGNMLGVGYMPEGTYSSPVVWEMMYENSWRKDTINIQKWCFNYIKRRYGCESKNARQAWNLLLNLNYGKYSEEQPPFNTLLNARPSINPDLRARTWASVNVTYKPQQLLPVWKLLLDASEECKKSDAYSYDIVDITRQVLSDAGTTIIFRLQQALKEKNRISFDKCSAFLMGVFDDLDEILATRKEFLLGQWIADARKWGKTNQEKKICEKNARSLITIWSENSQEYLKDYSNRTWAGLEKDFYKNRWKIWLDGMKNFDLDNQKQLDERITSWEINWTKKNNDNYSTQAIGNSLVMAESLYRKYLPILTIIYQ